MEEEKKLEKEEGGEADQNTLDEKNYFQLKNLDLGRNTSHTITTYFVRMTEYQCLAAMENLGISMDEQELEFYSPNHTAQESHYSRIQKADDLFCGKYISTHDTYGPSPAARTLPSTVVCHTLHEVAASPDFIHLSSVSYFICPMQSQEKKLGLFLSLK